MIRSSTLNLFDGTDFIQKFEIKNNKDNVAMSATNQASFYSQGFNMIKTDALGATIASVNDVVGSINSNASNIAQEVIDRTSAVAGVQSNLDSETSARQSADSNLQNNIDAEASARQSADTNLQAQITTLQSQVSSGVDWKAPVNNISELQAFYATDQKGSVRLVKDQKDAFIKVDAGTGEDLSSLGLTGEASNSYVRFLDSVEIAAGIANEASARSAGDATLQSNIDVEKGRIDAILSGADVNLDTFAEVVSYVNSLDVTQLNLITTLQNDLAQLRADHDALRAEFDAMAPGPRGGPNAP